MASEDLPFVEKRIPFKYGDRTIYEWSQTIDEVNIYIQPPPGVTAKAIECNISATHLTLGIKGNPPYINEDFFSKVKTNASFWTWEDGEIHITLSKMTKAETWTSALKGHISLNPVEEEQVKKSIMLERFQEENPGFDFSGAQFNGMVPDPKEFMGGVKYK